MIVPYVEQKIPTQQEKISSILTNKNINKANKVKLINNILSYKSFENALPLNIEENEILSEKKERRESRKKQQDRNEKVQKDQEEGLQENFDVLDDSASHNYKNYIDTFSKEGINDNRKASKRKNLNETKIEKSVIKPKKVKEFDSNETRIRKDPTNKQNELELSMNDRDNSFYAEPIDIDQTNKTLSDNEMTFENADDRLPPAFQTRSKSNKDMPRLKLKTPRRLNKKRLSINRKKGFEKLKQLEKRDDLKDLIKEWTTYKQQRF